jgi:hypothetical protein
VQPLYRLLNDCPTTQDSNFEIPFSGNAFEIAQEIPASRGNLGVRDFFANDLPGFGIRLRLSFTQLANA